MSALLPKRLMHARSRSGFTLVELLISVVILSIGVVAVLHAFERSLFALGSARDHLWSNLLIREKISEIEVGLITGDSESIDSGMGDFDEPYEGFAWESSNEEFAIQESAEGVTNKVLSIELTIWRRGVNRDYVVQTLRAY